MAPLGGRGHEARHGGQAEADQLIHPFLEVEHVVAKRVVAPVIGLPAGMVSMAKTLHQHPTPGPTD